MLFEDLQEITDYDETISKFDWVNLFLSILTDGKEYLLVYLYMIVLILTLEIKNMCWMELLSKVSKYLHMQLFF